MLFVNCALLAAVAQSPAPPATDEIIIDGGAVIVDETADYTPSGDYYPYEDYEASTEPEAAGGAAGTDNDYVPATPPSRGPVKPTTAAPVIDNNNATVASPAASPSAGEEAASSASVPASAFAAAIAATAVALLL